MVLVQKWSFFRLFFLANIGKENVFYDILERRNPFLGYKIKKFKKTKKWQFSKGVNPWFGSKIAHFSNFFFTQLMPGKYFFWQSRTKKSFSRLLKQEVQKVENLTFSMVLVKKYPFFRVFFLGNVGQENVFYDLLEGKNDFLDYKNKKFKKSKNWPFSKRVNPWFG